MTTLFDIATIIMGLLAIVVFGIVLSLALGLLVLRRPKEQAPPPSSTEVADAVERWLKMRAKHRAEESEMGQWD